jgi:parallel beta-helix repeat protein
MHRFNNDMVFADGQFLQSAGWEGEVDENTFYIDYDEGKVYIGVDPSIHDIEITAFNIAIHRVTDQVHGKRSDKKGLIIKGITFTQYAYRAIEIEGTEPEGVSPESEHGKEVVGTTIEDCTISFCSRVAAYLRGDNLTIRRCKISDTSTEGIYIIGSSDALLEKNIFMRNNIENITGYFPAAVKIFNQSYRVTCRDNLVTDQPNSNGIWYDVGNVDGVFVNNWVENVGYIDPGASTEKDWPFRSGFFFEISKGAVCAGNVFVNCDHGVFVLNSSDVRIYNNTFVNSVVNIKRDERVAEGDRFGWHASTGPDIDKRFGHVLMNNLLTANPGFVRPLLLVQQPDNLCSKLSNQQLEQVDNNMYIKTADSNNQALIIWSPEANDNCLLKFESPEELHNVHAAFSENSKYYALNNNALFKSIELENYQLLNSFKESIIKNNIPADIRDLLGIEKDQPYYIGAYYADE